MNELQKTGLFAGIAAVLVLIAFLTTPKVPVAPEFNETGEPFYPEFKDPQAVASIEITQLTESGGLRRFSVLLQEGRWVIPSRWNHPADAKGRLARTAAAMIDLRKEALRSDNPQDHVEFSVVDPTEKETGYKGNGTRITLKDKSGSLLCDYVVGAEVKGKPGFRFVRLPGNKRVFETKISYQLSAHFGDWVETDVLKADADLFRKIDFTTYRVEMVPRPVVKDSENNTLVKGDGGAWKLDTLKETEELNLEAVNEFIGAIDDFRISDVRRKTPGMIKVFAGEGNKVTQTDAEDLESRGFQLGQHGIVGIEGDVEIRCTDGIVYRLWFGRGVPDSDGGQDVKESRYVLVHAMLDEGAFPAPPEPKPTKDDGTPKTDDELKREREQFEKDKQARNAKVEAGKAREKDLLKRFSEWYYVASGEQYRKVRKTHADLTRAKGPKPGDKPHEHKPGDDHK